MYCCSDCISSAEANFSLFTIHFSLKLFLTDFFLNPIVAVLLNLLGKVRTARLDDTTFVEHMHKLRFYISNKRS